MEQSELLRFVVSVLERLDMIQPSSGLKVDVIVPPPSESNSTRLRGPGEFRLAKAGMPRSRPQRTPS